MPIQGKLALIVAAMMHMLSAGAAPTVARANNWLTSEQKARADALISVFENNTRVTSAHIP